MRSKRSKLTLGCLGGLAFLLIIVFVAIVASFAEEDPVTVERQPVKNTPVPTPTFDEARIHAREISYDSLFRTVDQYFGERLYFRGQVEQVQSSSGDEYLLRVNVSEGEWGFWEDDVRLDYWGERLLEDDIIEFVGEVQGLWKYQTVFGRPVRFRI